jgi:hypothetical protein
VIRKSIKLFRRKRKDGIGNDVHYERVQRETWWLFWIVPLYQRDAIVAHNM